MKINTLKIVVLMGLAFSFTGIYSCKEAKKTETEPTEISSEMKKEAEPFFQLSLAQWSMHKMVIDQDVDPYTFAEKAKGWGFTGLEYVSGLYYKELEKSNFSKEAMAIFVEKCNAESAKYGMRNVLIMIDGQGDLATTDAKDRKKAVENHYKWVDAAAAMGCHSIRVNLAGSQNPEEWVSNSVDGLKQLATYAKEKNVNIIVENHGGLSSNASKLVEVMKAVNMENCGTLPDFGNFCVKRKDGSYYNGECIEEYDMYQGVMELMPYAKGVSAKSYNFNDVGNETRIDYSKMLKIIEDAGYTGFIGVEYEGDELSEEAGILATKELLLNASNTLE
ncbi:sugar phosphate isomerase/epimerase family protein [Sediminicola arcticus]|jgi:sugar phosphate isomerase/epimerase|uniref:Sugar phosphate isomerase/epimerase family protein n=1 Tax=Sediminicola arcticus TaxID=1574308 RepID=A0ABV2SR98_9FLAO